MGMQYEKWSLGYWLLKKYIKLFDLIIYKKIVITGKENIPKNKPLLFAPNHQNALSDPMAILLHTKFQPVWLGRADIFKNKIAARILRFLKIMPVYRIRDGKDQLSKNDQTFADSIKVLESHKALALFPEAAHSSKRQMLAHKKAVPRIVFMAEEKAGHNLDIQIVPAGIYYSSYWKFNRTVLVNYGKPIKVNDYLDVYKDNPNAATIQLREAIYNAILPLTINIESKKHYEAFELIREIYGKHFLLKSREKNSVVNRFQSDQILTNKLNEFEKEKPEEAVQLAKQAEEYNSHVRKHNLRSWLVEAPKNNFWYLGLNKILLLVGLPVFLFGFIFNAIPFFAIDIPVRKKIKDIAFWSTFVLALSLILFPVVYLLQMWACSSLLPYFWMKIIFLISLPLAGKIAFRWYILFLKTLGRGNLLVLKLFNKTTYKKLQKEKTELFNSLDKFVEAP